MDTVIDQLLTVSEVMALTKLGRTTINAELKSRRLASVKICGRRRIPTSALRIWIETMASQ
jgi:excisionase family DNA binding protein